LGHRVNKKEFKETEMSKIPEDWSIRRIGELIELYGNGIWGSDPIKGVESYPVIRSTEITHEGKINFSNIASRIIPKDKVSRYRLKDGDILVVGSSGSPHLIGRVALFKSLNDKNIYLFSNFLIRIRVKDINSKFLYYFLSSSRYYQLLRYMQQTSTGLRNLPKKEFIRIKLPIPTLIEQNGIATILSTVGQSIEEVDGSIAKTLRLKKALMQKLLTKGIGHEEFKETEIGGIPKEWGLVEMEEVTDINKELKDPRRELQERKFFYIDIDSVENETGSIKDVKEIIGRKAPSRARREVRYNDVIMSTVRPYLKAFAIIPKIYDRQICSTGFAVLRCKDKILPQFLLYTLFSKALVSQFNRAMVGAQYPALNTSQVKRLRIPLPSIQEQNKIAEILSTVDIRIKLLKKKKKKLERVKKGLMNDLLTGRRRVKVEA